MSLEEWIVGVAIGAIFGAIFAMHHSRNELRKAQRLYEQQVNMAWQAQQAPLPYITTPVRNPWSAAAGYLDTVWETSAPSPFLDPALEEEDTLLIGYKSMDMRELSPSLTYLESVTTETVWETGRLEAACQWPNLSRAAASTDACKNHLETGVLHHCGIFAYKHPLSAHEDGHPFVVEVALSGPVIEYSQGYRAHVARIERIFYTDRTAMTTARVNALRQRYLCPVEPYVHDWYAEAEADPSHLGLFQLVAQLEEENA